jgi:hypothetical protein
MITERVRDVDSGKQQTAYSGSTDLRLLPSGRVFYLHALLEKCEQL